jgi:hypothetical protein
MLGWNIQGQRGTSSHLDERCRGPQVDEKQLQNFEQVDDSSVSCESMRSHIVINYGDKFRYQRNGMRTKNAIIISKA